VRAKVGGCSVRRARCHHWAAIHTALQSSVRPSHSPIHDTGVGMLPNRQVIDGSLQVDGKNLHCCLSLPASPTNELVK
jgi:hypothetical protein